MTDPAKKECIICYRTLTKSYNPPNRPEACECQYDVHKTCFQSWIKTKQARYACLICRHIIPGPHAAQEDVQNVEPQIEVVQIDPRLLTNLIFIFAMFLIIIFSPF